MPSRIHLVFVLYLLFIAPVQAQTPSLDDAKTVQDAVDWFKQATEEAGENYQTRENIFKQANKKIAELAEGGADVDVDAVIAGFKSAVTIRRNSPVATVKKMVEEEKLPWIILSEALTERAKQPKQGVFYAIRTIPTMLLADKEGNIIMTNARGDALKTKLAEIFK